MSLYAPLFDVSVKHVVHFPSAPSCWHALVTCLANGWLRTVVLPFFMVKVPRLTSPRFNSETILNITNKIDKLLENETTNNYKDSKILQENITDQLGQKGLVDYHVARRDLSLNKEVLNNAISKMNFESLSNEELKYLYPDVGYFTGSVNDKQIKQVLGLNNDVNLDVTPLRIKIRNILKNG